ncbi:MAG: 4-alpha-glucanotransferase [Bacteroidota bacterium]
MKIKFQIDYRTHWGQGLYVSGSCPELGGSDEGRAVAMQAGPGEQWEAEIEVKASSFTYQYFLKDEQGSVFWESGAPRHFGGMDTYGFVRLKDFWRSGRHLDNALYTSPFQKAFFHRSPGKKDPAKPVEGPSVRLQLRAPRIGPDYVFAVSGGTDGLGNWEEDRVLLMNDQDYPVWQVDVPLAKDQAPFEYKFVIYSLKQKKVVTWEARDNRYFPAFDISSDRSLCITEEYFEYPVGSWKAAGVAIPVFSLRSAQGAGVGEFLDINQLTDWAVKVGMKIIQVLPVNDTVATHTWVDSYPYAASSVNALHPIYANLGAIGALKDKKAWQRIQKEAEALNGLEQVDYEKVMKLKSEFFSLSYQENKASFLKKKEFKQFFKANASWLPAYAAFSYLRDKHGTVDFSQWGPYATMDAKKLAKLCTEDSGFYDDITVHYYIQYHLDKQLKTASEYAREQGVVLKGDIPIGIYRYSVDAWLEPELYNMACQAGAPPDDFSISGQNWGFPTYNWNAMAEDGFGWWKQRLVKMSEYFDVFRIDHILGFFRIWEIPWEHVEGIMGRFNPALPVHVGEFGHWGIAFDRSRLTEPYIRSHMVHEIFGSHAHKVFEEFLDEYQPGSYRMKAAFDTQRKVKAYIDQEILGNPTGADFLNWLRNNLYRLLAEVLFLEAPLSNGEAWNPRIALHSTYSYRELDPYTQQRIDELYIHFFYRRHNDFWRDSAMSKLPALQEATDMLICGEDLGMVPQSVPGVMDELGILSLAIQRMPNDDREFIHPADTPYMSVCSTGSHDMSTLREWWQEDSDRTQRFYNQILGHWGGAPYYCEPWVAKDVVNQHLHSPSMLAIFPIQDLVAMDGRLRSDSPEAERINVPAITQHYWRYRFHLSLEELLQEEDFNSMLRQMVDQGGRRADY